MSNSHNSKKSEDDEESELPPPPDGGWGWVIVFGSFMIHIVTDGVTYSFGVFYDKFLDYFNEGKGATAWILSILVGVTLCSGPISSAFVNRWGCRPVTIAGAILASGCLILSCFAQNVTTLYFTIGIGTGLGFGLIYLPAIVSVTTYFEKRRSLATGIAVCGSGFGTFIFAPLITVLLREYEWRGAMLIIAAIVLECTIFGALFRPLEYETEKPSRDNREELLLEKPLLDKPPLLDMSSFDKSSLQPPADGKPMHVSYKDISPAFLPEDSNKTNIKRPRSVGLFTLPKNVRSSTLEKNGNICNGQLKPKDTKRLALSHPALSSAESDTSQHLKRPRPLNRPDVFYQGSLFNIPYYRSKQDLRSTDETDLMRRRFSSHGNISISVDSDVTMCGFVPCSRETKETLKEMLDFSLFKDPVFILFTLSNFFTSIGFNIPYVYIVPKAKELDISDEKASLLLSVIGIANTVGRIILGYVSDNPKINRLLVYNLCLTICGFATAFSALCMDFYSLVFYGVVFGFTIGAYVGLTSVILVDLLGLERLTNAFGLLLLFQGIASLIGPPIAGELYDILKSYDPGFYVSGVTIAMSGIMLFAIPVLQKSKTVVVVHKDPTDKDHI